MNPLETETGETGQVETIDVSSWWGAVAALMLLQSYSLILLQGLVHLFNPIGFAPVTLVFLAVLALAQAGGLRAMNQYLQTHQWGMALQFWHRPLEILKFFAVIISTGVYLYLITGHLPIPRDPELYTNVGITGSLLFQLFNLGISCVLNWLLKLMPKVEAMRSPQGIVNGQRNTGRGGMAVLTAIPLGILFVAASCYERGLFYILGVIGYGAIAIALSAALATRRPACRNRAFPPAA